MQTPLRVLAYIHSFEPGGVERVALRLCRAWQREGAQVSVLIGRTDGAMRADAPRLNYVRYSSGSISTAWFETMWMILCLWRQVRSARPDVIFCAGNSYTVVAVAVRLLLCGDCPPIVAKVSNSLDRSDMGAPIRFAYRLWLRLQGRQIACWVSMAASMRAEIASSMRVPEAEVAVIEDPALREREARALADARDGMPCRSTAGRLFLSAGRLAPQKRFDLLIRAFARSAAAQDRLVILGEGPGRRALEALARRLGVAQQVVLPGHSTDVGDWLARADTFVLASDYEGVPAVLIEAMAAGLPIVATDSSAAMGELLGQSRFGRLVACGDEAALALAIAETRVAADIEGARRQAARFQVERAGPAYFAIMRAAASSCGKIDGPPSRNMSSSYGSRRVSH